MENWGGRRTWRSESLVETSYLSQFSREGPTQAWRLRSAARLLQKNKYRGETMRLRNPGHCLSSHLHRGIFVGTKGLNFDKARLPSFLL